MSVNAAPIQSTAEAVLAEAQSIHAEVNAAQSVASPEAKPDAKAEVEVEEGTGTDKRTRNLSWNDAMKQVPPDIAKLMREMQGDYTRKTQELAEQRKDFLREREALMKGAQTLKDKELPEYDPFNEGSIQARIENEVNRRLREVLEPMQQEYEVMQAEESYQSFIREHGDLQTDTALRSEVQHLLEANPNLDLQTAYWAAKGKQTKAQAEQDKTRTAQTRAAQKEAALTATAAPRKAAVTAVPDRSTVRKMSNADILALAKSMNRQ